MCETPYQCSERLWAKSKTLTASDIVFHLYRRPLDFIAAVMYLYFLKTNSPTDPSDWGSSRSLSIEYSMKRAFGIGQRLFNRSGCVGSYSSREVALVDLLADSA